MSLELIEYQDREWYKAKDIIKLLSLSENNVSNILGKYIPEKYKVLYHNGTVEFWVLDKLGIGYLLLESLAEVAINIKTQLIYETIPFIIVDDFYELGVNLPEFDGNTWYKAKGCIEKLDYAVNNVTNIVSRYVETENKQKYFDGNKEYWLLNQIGLAKLILQSKSAYSIKVKDNLCQNYIPELIENVLL
ncbi:MAG: Bro-N domain-containing protein [Okeania sp. SIO4D6]|nr:BRO family protein [Okeania sp. SIO2G5]NEP03534.1 Bro-N domain-containing protein [Okeania sp. SIO4D6]NEP76008.1 Bro-N domain-containing protein [Okeania sp. SIO2G5]